MGDGLEEPLPISDRAEYDRTDEDGLVQCPVCGTLLDPRWHDGEVVQPVGLTSAIMHAHLMETDPGDGPFYCPECWKRHVVEVRQHRNHQLSDFSPEVDVYYGP